jgi:peptidoglycan/LPS O-acetylase OafA/YrhL
MNNLEKTKKPEIKSSNFYYQTLEHWRGIAALSVVLFHGFGPLYNKPLHPSVVWLKMIAGYGWLGVHLFFVISDYCITASAYKTFLKNDTFITFIKNRFMRLVPTYWIAFILTIGIGIISSPFNSTNIANNIPKSWLEWLGNILLIAPYINTAFYGVVYWTLSVEFGFYLIVMLLLIIAQKINIKTAIFMGLTLAFSSVFMFKNPNIPQFISYWCEFFCGTLVFMAITLKLAGKNYQHNLCLGLILSFLAMGIILNYQYNAQTTLVFASVYAMLIYGLYYFDEKIFAINELKWLGFIGLMSYSLYLLHVPIEGRVINLGIRFFPTNSWVFLPIEILAWSVAIAISYIFYRIVEKPLNQWRYTLNK